ncbi:MAG: hypothetical protein KGD64_09965 [Candidatus Heimdallarchaeota archaeon]|nr:hypothetical protein [Candidatus Heimdallarchaeota archaeon]
MFLIVITSFIQVQFTTAQSINQPPPRYGHEMVYDEQNNQTILFGGADPSNIVSNFRETWIYSSQLKTWTTISSSASPSNRIGHKMVYNSNSGKIILFGGMETADYTRLNDMWIFNPEASEWSELTPSQSPSARSDYGMYFDPIFNVIVLFGGYLSNDLHSSETWVYNFTVNNWYQINPLIKPAERYGHTFTYDNNLGVGVLFGGRVIDLMADTWFFNLSSSSSWTLKTPSTNPIKRYWSDIVYNTYEQNFIMFGGDNEQSPTRALGDTWIFSSSISEWSLSSPSVSPSPRNNHAMVFDSYLNQTLLFGGYGEDYSKVYGDFWIYESDTNWSLISSSSNNSWWIVLGSTGGGVLLIAGVIIVILFVRRSRRKKHRKIRNE